MLTVLRMAAWMFSWLVPKDHRAALLGDLAEEYAERMKGKSLSSARWWYLRQLVASVPSLFWFRVTQGAWLSTLGVALLAFLATGQAQFLTRQAISSTFPQARFGLDLVVFFPMVAFIGYFAERLRRGSAVVLGIMMLVSITLMTLGASGGGSPLWYRLAWLLVGPVAAISGFLPALRRSR